MVLVGQAVWNRQSSARIHDSLPRQEPSAALASRFLLVQAVLVQSGMCPTHLYQHWLVGSQVVHLQQHHVAVCEVLVPCHSMCASKPQLPSKSIRMHIHPMISQVE